MMRNTRLVTTMLHAGLVAAIVAVAGCGAPATPPAGSATSADMGPSPAPAAASPAPTPAPIDVQPAIESALAIYTRIPLSPADPATGFVWVSGPSSADHLSATVKTRLAELGARGYFADGPGGRGEDYLTGSQNGLFVAPPVRTP